MSLATLRKPAAVEEYVPDGDARRDGFVGVGIDPDRRRGRGATVNPAGRFEQERREPGEYGEALGLHQDRRNGPPVRHAEVHRPKDGKSDAV